MKNSLLLLFLCFAACASVTTSYDFDKTADFEKNMTYGWDKHVQHLVIDQLTKKSIISAVDNEMGVRDYAKSEGPDFLVDVHVKPEQEGSETATTDGAGTYGRWGYGWGGGFSTTAVDFNSYANGTLFINIIDRASEKIVWQGRGEKTLDDKLSAEKRDAQIKEAVAAIFKTYPILPSSGK
jgi:hypothetical protein